VTRARAAFGFAASTDFREGLTRTIEWYKAHRTGAVGQL
jgi:nucleoside-diphosphate-sugar epimerase